VAPASPEAACRLPVDYFIMRIWWFMDKLAGSPVLPCGNRTSAAAGESTPMWKRTHTPEFFFFTPMPETMRTVLNNPRSGFSRQRESERKTS
jgi:hypothetical protein